jgi:hypothetical protein
MINMHMERTNMAAPDLSVFGKIRTIDDYRRAEQEFMAKKRQNAPASVQLANEIQRARASGDTNRLNDLIMSAKLMDRGVVTDQMGNPMAMQGYGDAVGSIEGAKSGYKQQAQKDVDLVMNPQIAGGEAGARLQQELGYGPLIKDATIRQEAKTQAELELPGKQSKAEDALSLIDQIQTSPGLSAVIGAPNPFKGRIPFVGNIAGSPAADFQAKLDQLGGKQFLEAFESLKGGGQITEVEGAKATNAIARMQTTQSEPEFLKALEELRGVVLNGAQRARQAAGGIQLYEPEENTNIVRPNLVQQQKVDPSKIPMSAIKYLKANPGTTQAFDAMYGQGASKMVLK